MGRGGQDKKKHWVRGLSNIEKHVAGGGGGVYLAKKTSGVVGYILYILKSRRSGAKTLP